jgi:hypothetical protein
VLIDAYGMEYLEGKDTDGVEADVRVKINEKRIYFKGYLILDFCRLRYHLSASEVVRFKRFLTEKAQFNDRTTMSKWYRSTYSVPFGMFTGDILVRLKLGEDAEE